MPTLNFGFDQLNGGDAAGYTSINSLLTSIDTILNTRFGGIINTTNYNALGVGDAGKIIEWTGSAFTTSLIDNANISASAAIAYSKLNLANSIVNADVNAAAAIAYSKLNLSSSIQTGDFAAGATAPKATNLAGGSGGSIPYQSAADTTAMLSNGANGQVLTSQGGTAAPSWQNISSGSVTLAGDVTGAANANSIAADAVTYAKLNGNAKRYDVTTGGAGLVYTSSGNLSTTSASTNATQQPLVMVDSTAGAVTLTLPTTGFSTIPGATITIAQSAGTNTVTIAPGASVFINGSNSNTYVLGGLYSVVTLILMGTGNAWIITGDFI